MLIIFKNNNILLQTLLSKMNDSRENAVCVLEKWSSALSQSMFFYGQQLLLNNLPNKQAQDKKELTLGSPLTKKGPRK